MPPDQQNRVIQVNGLRPAPTGSSFEDAQIFLQQAAAQLKVGNQAKEESRDRIAAIREQMIRDAYEKDVMFDIPIEENMRKVYEFTMNPKKLAEIEFRLSLTPTGIAARYIRWIHESLGTDAPNPLSRWLKKLEAEIQERYPHYTPHRVVRGAERQVFTLVAMYASALLGWIQDFCAALSVDVMATAFTMRNPRLELGARFTAGRACAPPKHLGGRDQNH